MLIPLTDPPITLQDPASACDAIDAQGFLPAFNGKQKGPYVLGAAQYVTSQRPSGFDQVLFRNHLVVTKSVNGGDDWFVQDEANSPLAGATSNSNATVQFDAANGYLHIVYSSPSPGSHLFYARYNLNLDQWGAPVDSGIALGAVSAINSSVSVLQSDGVMVVWYQNSIDSGLHRVTITNQIWGAPTATIANGVFDCYGAVVGGGDTSYVAYRSGVSAISIVSVNSSGAIVNGPTLIGAPAASNCKQIVIFNGKLQVPLCTGGSGSGGQRASFYETNSLVDFTSTLKDLHDGLVIPNTCQDHYIKAAELDGILYFGWIQTFLDVPNSIFKFYAASYDGITISAPVLMWDELALPVTCAAGLPEDSYFMEGISMIADEDSSSIGVITFAEVNQDFGQGLVFFSLSALPPLSIICDNPLAGQVGQAYTHAFPASGGTLPYTFGISGAVPPGLLFNPATGVLSGVASASGVYAIRVTVTDANSNSARVDCTITITAAPAIIVNCNNPPAGVTGVFYSHAFTGFGGSGALAFSYMGTIPFGLTLNSVSGVISGIPLVLGTFNFTVIAIDAFGEVGSVDCSITIVCSNSGGQG